VSFCLSTFLGQRSRLFRPKINMLIYDTIRCPRTNFFINFLDFIRTVWVYLFTEQYHSVQVAFSYRLFQILLPYMSNHITRSHKLICPCQKVSRELPFKNIMPLTLE